MPDLDFSGKRILVTGASRGIGYAVARGFAARGGSPILLAEDETIQESARRLSAETCAPAVAAVCDVTDRNAVAESIAMLGELDIVVNNAGIELLTPILDPDPGVEATFERVIRINLLGSYYVTREVVKRMPTGGRLIYTASGWAKTGDAEFGAYCPSKHAIRGLVRTLAK